VATWWRFLGSKKAAPKVIQNVTGSRIEVPIIVGLELCYLQLRMICELIALASGGWHDFQSTSNSVQVIRWAAHTRYSAP
jgi:hypothetical protein